MDGEKHILIYVSVLFESIDSFSIPPHLRGKYATFLIIPLYIPQELLFVTCYIIVFPHPHRFILRLFDFPVQPS